MSNDINKNDKNNIAFVGISNEKITQRMKFQK